MSEWSGFLVRTNNDKNGNARLAVVVLRDYSDREPYKNIGIRFVERIGPEGEAPVIRKYGLPRYLATINVSPGEFRRLIKNYDSIEQV